jgi:hypothetical protein
MIETNKSLTSAYSTILNSSPVYQIRLTKASQAQVNGLIVLLTILGIGGFIGKKTRASVEIHESEYDFSTFTSF